MAPRIRIAHRRPEEQPDITSNIPEQPNIVSSRRKQPFEARPPTATELQVIKTELQKLKTKQYTGIQLKIRQDIKLFEALREKILKELENTK